MRSWIGFALVSCMRRLGRGGLLLGLALEFGPFLAVSPFPVAVMIRR